MTRIEFHVLESADEHDRLHALCRLVERTVGRGHRVLVHSDDVTLLKRVDALLWSFDAESFVPHAPFVGTGGTTSADDPVVLTTEPTADDRQCLFNLSATVPLCFSRFERTIEVVSAEPAVRDAARERYRFYRERGYPLQHRPWKAPAPA